MPWRETTDPWAILVSEVMLQQTRVGRVLEKYGPFLERFPDPAALAAAPLKSVLAAWRGLGYNRRALQLKAAARLIRERGGMVPETEAALRDLPGIGPATAGAILVYAFGRPAVFIETNIRAVYIHHFFGRRTGVTDAELRPLVAASLDRRNPRLWYHALMDYGTLLKSTSGNAALRSAHHARQTPFEGSGRQIRGEILRLFLDGGSRTEGEVAALLARDAPRVGRCLEDLRREGFLRRGRNGYRLD
jgi:A/G-specific adenine glycosylase